MTLRKITLAVALVLVATVGFVSPAQADETPNGPIFTAMNTSETLPDGIWFRNSPHTADTDRVTGHGPYMGERLQLRCYAWGDSVGPYNDTLWYKALDVSRPTNAGVENSGFINAHYVDDGQNANVVDAGVPDCSAPSAAPTVSLAQGPSAPAGYRYAVTLDHFAAGRNISITCFDSVSPGGFYTFSLTTDGSGHASTASYCYSADGPDHWVVANGVESNHVQWAQGSAPGPAPDPTTQPSAPPTTPPPTPEHCAEVIGQRFTGGLMAETLFAHYLTGNGSQVVIDFSYFSHNDAFAQFARGLQVGVANSRTYSAAKDSDMFEALGTFSVTRTSENCYYVYDVYDFDPDKVQNWPYIPLWLLPNGKNYMVQASGRL